LAGKAIEFGEKAQNEG